MKRWLFFLVGGVAVGSLSFWVSGYATLNSAVHAYGPLDEPYTAIVLEQEFDGNGKKLHSESSIRARRSDGSEVRSSRRTFPDGRDYEMREITDISSMRRMTLNGAVETVTTYILGARKAEYLRYASPCARLQERAETTFILGYEARKIEDRVSVSGGEHSVNVQTWVVPELGCLVLREVATFRKKGKVESSITREIVELTLGQPDSALFVVPANYKESAPSEVFLEYQRRFPNAPPQSSEAASRADDAYRSNR
jgi:hypothetical protein